MYTIEVDSEREIKKFIDFPFKLYGKEDKWVPPLIDEMRSVFDSSHPFYQDEESAAQAFLVEEEEKVRGRIMALKPEPYNRRHNSKAAFFHFFEVDDAGDNQLVTKKLFAAVAHWAQERDLETVRGPMGMSVEDGHGILVEGFNQRPGMSMTWNYPYYDRLVINAGFKKALDSYSDHINLSRKIREDKDKIDRIRENARATKRRQNLETLQFGSKRELKKRMDWLVPQMTNLYNKSFQDLSLQPMSEPEIRHLAESLLDLFDSRTISLPQLVVKDDKVIGFLLVYPNIVPALRKVRGTLYPFGWLRLIWARSHTTWVDANALGVLPEYQGRGVTALLYYRLLKILNERSFENLIVTQILENNYKSIREMNKVLGIEFSGAHRRTHRIYEKKL